MNSNIKKTQKLLLIKFVMILKNKIEEITLNKKGIILSYKEREQTEILYSELNEIYITVNKIKPFSEFFILIAVCIASFSILILQTNIILVLSLLIIFITSVKMNTYKRYGLKICLKNGETIEKKIEAKSKHEIIDIVNDVKKEIYNYKIKKSNEGIIQYSV
jgi:putative lipoic acid-binding regulatory protein